MPNKDVIVIGTSLGGTEALKALVSTLPQGLNASLFVVRHLGASGLGLLPEILKHAGCLPASNAKDGEAIRPGHLYVAPPDHHLLLERSGSVRVTRDPKENRCRPAVDPLFRSAAHAFGPRVMGVILTGGLDDGTAGLWAVKECGGTAIVQHPHDALAPSMPLSALKHVAVDYCVPLNEIAPLLVQLTRAPAGEKGTAPVSKLRETDVHIAKEGNAFEGGILDWGEPSLYACPECHAVLLQRKEGSNLRFRCHTGHAYSLDTLLAEVTERTQEAWWSALRSSKEIVLLMRHMAARLSECQHDGAAESLRKQAQEAQQCVELVRQAVRAHEMLRGCPFVLDPD